MRDNLLINTAMIKFTINMDEKTFVCDYSVIDPENPDFCPTVDSAIYDALYLLSCIYDKKEVAESLFGGNDFMEFAKDGFKRLQKLKELHKDGVL